MNNTFCRVIISMVAVSLSALTTSAAARQSFQGVGDLPGGSTASRANAVSSDGLVVVGRSTSANGTEAFRWTLGGGIVGLGDLLGVSFSSEAHGVSGDGSVVVGEGSAAAGIRAFIWDATNGMRNLQDVLVNDHGLDLTGWTLTRALGVSADGLTIVGEGKLSGFFSGQAWIATLPPELIPGDITGDGTVNVTDLLQLLAAWGLNPGHAADINGDDMVNVTDLLLLLANWG